MKIIITLLLVSLVSPLTLADGFICHTVNDDLKIQVYNQTQPHLGTRNAAVMVISDLSVSEGRQTVAVFTASEGTLSNTSSKYYANVDERFNNIPKGELLAGTKIDYLKSIILDIDFSYNQPVSFGDSVEGWMILTREMGSQIKEKVICNRYLKNN